MLVKALAAAAGNFGGGYSINDSLRFNDNDSAYLSRTPATAGNRKTWTWSGWVKLGNLTINRTLFAARLATNNEDTFQILLISSDKINIGGYDYGSSGDPLLRDPSGWYHIVVAFDTTQATSANRIKTYINGTQITLVGSFPPLNLNGAINNTQQHNIGFRPTNNDRPFDGYMAEINFIDGQALTPDDFGEINKTTGEWSPIAYSGTYGTNGFYLQNTFQIGSDIVTTSTNWDYYFAQNYSGSINTNWNNASSANLNLFPYSYSINTARSDVNFVTKIDFTANLPYEGNTSATPANGNINFTDGSRLLIAGNGGNNVTGEDFRANGFRFLWEDERLYYALVNDTERTATLTEWTAASGKTIQSVSAYRGFSAGGMTMTVFELELEGNAQILDGSGNNNNFDAFGVLGSDVMIDTPTNNFATLNPLQNTIDVTYFEGNLKTTQTANYRTVTATQFVSSGKWYFEHYGIGEIGVVRDGAFNPTNRLFIEVGEYAYNWFAGNKYNNNVSTAYGDGWGATDITACALDLDAGTIEFFKNNVSQGIAFTGLPAGSYTFAIGHAGETEWVNFGADSSFAGNKTRQGNTDANGIGDFYYEPPAGYLALCTENLPAPAIEQPETQFNVVLDTGANIKATAEALYDSSLIWIKDRANSNNHQLIDTVRGTGVLQSNTTAAETTYSASSGNSVAWVWKAGGTAVTNTDGAITSQVSANVEAGFSIVSWTGNGATASVGHGLQQKPDFIIVKSINSAGGWFVQQYVYVPSGNAAYSYLNTTNAFIGFTDTLTTDSVFQQGGGSGVTYIAYAFHSVEGFSKFDSYVGNGSTNGPFVYTGFKPAFVMIKRTNSTGDWVITDNKRDPENDVDKRLFPNLSLAESSTANLFDYTANGFKIRRTDGFCNASGETYIYMTFAEHPFKFSTGR